MNILVQLVRVRNTRRQHMKRLIQTRPTVKLAYRFSHRHSVPMTLTSMRCPVRSLLRIVCVKMRTCWIQGMHIMILMEFHKIMAG